MNRIKSETKQSEKDYWRTPQNLLEDALRLLDIYQFDKDCCAKSSAEKIGYASDFISESHDALQCANWFNYDSLNPSFCNPPFSRKWEFVKKAKEQVSRYVKSVLFVLPYAPCTKAWREHVDGSNCIVYVPDGRYQFLKPDGTKAGNCSFAVALVLFVPFFTNGAIYINYKIGDIDNEKNN